MPLKVGWLAYSGPSYWCTCLSGYTDLGWIQSSRALWNVLRTFCSVSSNTY